MSGRRTPLFALAAVFLLAGGLGAQQFVESQLVASGLNGPVIVSGPPGSSRVLYVVEGDAIIRVVRDGVTQPTPLIDLSGKVTTGNEGGLNGMVLHPDFLTNGWVYFYYLSSTSTTILERYTISDTDPFQLDPATATVIYGPIDNGGITFHPGGGIDFGPDGKLYLGIGDERAIPGSGCGAQDGLSPLGKVLRLNDDGTIPADNPFVGDPTVLDEIYLIGLRQPYKLRFDDATGDLFVTDVGESDREEVSVIPFGTAGGQNLGWKVHEGTPCKNDPECSAFTCDDPMFQHPVYEYQHGPEGVCVIGGATYNESAIGDLTGAFVFADLIGKIRSFEYTGVGISNFRDLTADVDPGAGLVIEQPTAVALDGQGRLHIADYSFNDPGAGEVYRLVPYVEAFVEAGPGLAGTNGVPQFEAHGNLDGGTWVVLHVSNAIFSPTLGHLIIGFSEINQSFKGGTLVPNPDLVFLDLPMTGGGTLTLKGVWPFGVDPGIQIWFQVWITDPAGPKGLSATPGIVGTTP